MTESLLCFPKDKVFSAGFRYLVLYLFKKYPSELSSRIQLRFGGVWAQRKGAQAGLFGEILLSDEETISKVRYWASIYYTAAVEFTTSLGSVHGPWGGSTGTGTVLQVSKMFSVYRYS